MGTIVVGVDGSDSSLEAVGFAAEEAALRGTGLRVVMALEVSEEGQRPSESVPEVLERRLRIVEEVVEVAVARAKEAQPDLPCEGAVRYGRPQTVLLEEGRGAELLVVGRRGQGGLASLVLGSVSRHVLDHAPCPVAVVPPSIG